VKRKPPDKAPPSPLDRARAAKEAAKRAALNALKKARRTAVREGVELSDWEGEFLGSIEDRIKTYGRAFADPEKGAAGAPLSMMQGRKLREITDKASGKPREWPKRRGFGPRKSKTIQARDEDV
jgi:hypothetical protein